MKSDHTDSLNKRTLLGVILTTGLLGETSLSICPTNPPTMVAYNKAKPLNRLGQQDPFAVQTQGGCLSEPSQPLYATSDTAIARDPPHPECKYLLPSAAGWVGCSSLLENGQHPCNGPANPGEGRRMGNQLVPLLCVLAGGALRGKAPAQGRWVWSALSPASSLSMRLLRSKLGLFSPAEPQARQDFSMSCRA